MIVYFIGMLIGSVVFHSVFEAGIATMIVTFLSLFPDSFYELLPCNFFDNGYLQRVGT